MSPFTDGRLRQLYQRSLEPPPGRAGCPSPERLLALVERRGPEAERLQTLDHAMACAGCRADFELLRSLERAGRERSFGARAPVPALPGGRASLLLAAGVASLALATATYWFALRGTAEAVRGHAGTGASVQLVSPRSEVPPAAGRRFIWHAVEGAVAYELEVLDAAGSPVYATRTADTVLALPAGVRLQPGQEYRWWVVARLADGSELRARLQPFHLP